MLWPARARTWQSPPPGEVIVGWVAQVTDSDMIAVLLEPRFAARLFPVPPQPEAGEPAHPPPPDGSSMSPAHTPKKTKGDYRKNKLGIF